MSSYELISKNRFCWGIFHADLNAGMGSVARCASTCQRMYGCRFFMFASDRHCHWVVTRSETCPEGRWRVGWSDLYQLKDKTVKMEAWDSGGRNPINNGRFDSPIDTKHRGRPGWIE